MADWELQGMDELLAKLAKLGAAASKIENQALKAGAQVLQQAIAERAPRSASPRQPNGKSQSWRTGQHAADNIKISRVMMKDGVKTVQVGITQGDTSHYFYLKFKEWGTSKQPAEPFMGPAYEEKKSDAIDAMKNVIRRGLGL